MEKVESIVERAGTDDVERVCRDYLAPLVEADGGEMYLVSVSPDDVHIHLAGTCAGCPGSTFTGDQMMTPVILGVAPKAKVRVTTGWLVPDGAKRVGAGESKKK